MPISLLSHTGLARPPITHTPTTSPPDAAFDAIPRFVKLCDTLRTAKPSRRSQWREPAVFFFDAARQAELVAARTPVATPADPLRDQIALELPGLLASVEVRHAARGIGLHEVAAASLLPAAKELAALLAVPDDETILVLHPAARIGVRVAVRGVADIHQFHVLLAGVAHEALGCPRPSAQLIAACSAIEPNTAMIAETPFQMFRPSAILPDGSLPEGFRGSDHWLWGTHPLASIPRIDGERVVLLGEPAFRQSWEVERRFPKLAASVKLLNILSPFAVVEHLGRLAGRPVPLTGGGSQLTQAA